MDLIYIHNKLYTWSYFKVIDGSHLDFVEPISTAGIVNRLFTSDVLVTSGFDTDMAKSVCFCLCNLVIFEN